MRKIVFSIIVLLALLLAAEVGVTILSQNGLEKAIRSQYELPDSLKVSINSFPFLLSLARNHLAELQLTWEDELDYGVEEGTLESMHYLGCVNLYDVELNMPSLLRGKLEVRDVSRIKATLGVDIAWVNDSLGLGEDGFYAEEGRLYRGEGDEKVRFKVKVTGSDTLTVEPYREYMSGEGLPQNPYVEVYTVVFGLLPLSAELENASLDGSNVVLNISIPMWEGYL